MPYPADNGSRDRADPPPVGLPDQPKVRVPRKRSETDRPLVPATRHPPVGLPVAPAVSLATPPSQRTTRNGVKVRFARTAPRKR